MCSTKRSEPVRSDKEWQQAIAAVEDEADVQAAAVVRQEMARERQLTEMDEGLRSVEQLGDVEPDEFEAALSQLHTWAMRFIPTLEIITALTPAEVEAQRLKAVQHAAAAAAATGTTTASVSDAMEVEAAGPALADTSVLDAEPVFPILSPSPVPDIVRVLSPCESVVEGSCSSSVQTGQRRRTDLAIRSRRTTLL